MGEVLNLHLSLWRHDYLLRPLRYQNAGTDVAMALRARVSILWAILIVVAIEEWIFLHDGVGLSRPSPSAEAEGLGLFSIMAVIHPRNFE